MQLSRQRLLHDTLRRYLRRQAWVHLDRLLVKTRPEDLAAILSTFAEKEQDQIFERLPGPEPKARLIVFMQSPFGRRVLDALAPKDVAPILAAMAPDDRTDIIADLRPEQAREVLEVLDHGDKAEVVGLMAYADDTAGGLMLPEFMALPAETTVEEAFIALREQSHTMEMANYIYVVGGAQELVGVLSLRKLVLAPQQKRIRDIMEHDVISVTPDTDQEAVARLVVDYALLAVPVVDETNKRLGIVTVDDVIGVLEEEAHEDILKMAGAGAPVTSDEGFLSHVRSRIPWLLAACAGGLLAALVLRGFLDRLQAHQAFALFLPVLVGVTGNVATQSAAVTARNLTTHQSLTARLWPALRRELGVGLTLGVLYAALVGGVAALLGDGARDGLAVGFALFIGIALAAALGALIPTILARFGIDRATATGHLVATCMQVVSVLVYAAAAIPLAAQLVAP